MSDRDKFDAWFDKEYPISGDCGRIKYRESSVRDLMIAAWQASRRAALEEAAQVCEALESRISKAMVAANENEGAPIDGGYLNACDDCSDAIRALAEGDKQ